VTFDELPGDCAREIGAANWSATPLGPPEGWPRSLHNLLFMTLSSAAPKLLLWSRNLIAFPNDAYLEFLGSEFRHALGKPYRELRPDIWPVVGEHIEAAFAGQARWLRDLHATSQRNGFPEEFHVSLSYTPVLDDDQMIGGVLAEVYDLTERVQRQEMLADENRRLQDLFANAPILIAYGTVPDFRLQFVNEAFEAFYGHRGLTGKTVAEAIPEAAEQGFVDILRHVSQSGEHWAGKNIPIELRASDGRPAELRYVDFVYQPIRGAGGEIKGILCSGSDETDRKIAEDLAADLKTRLLHASSMGGMGTMALTLAHELNQPLSAASTYLYAARRLVECPKAESAADAAEALRGAESAILRAGDIIRHTRSLVSSGSPATTIVSLRNAIVSALSVLRAGSASDHFEVGYEIAGDAEFVLADQVQLEQVFANLLRNASQASAGCERREALVTSSRKADMIEVTVRDWGKGLAEADHGNLFAALQPSTRGLGVGLSLTRTIIEAHGGAIWADQDMREGACFHFTLRAADPGQ
jgi:two-component system sensor kinase FixL